MSSKLLFYFPDRLKEFQLLLEECQRTLARDQVDPSQVEAQIEELENSIQNYLLPLPEEALSQEHRQKWLAVKTELQRTARLLKTEFVFWRSARSPERRHHYQTRLGGHCQQLTDFSGVMEQWLENDG